MNHNPEPLGTSALSSTPSTTHFFPIFWMLPSAFSSMVVRPPAMFPLVGWESMRSLVLWRSITFFHRLHIYTDFLGSAGVLQHAAPSCSPPVGSVVSPTTSVTPRA